MLNSVFWGYMVWHVCVSARGGKDRQDKQVNRDSGELQGDP